MNGTASIDKAGRLVIPKALRESLHMRAGDTVYIEQSGDSLVLRPKHEESRFYKAEDGLWVFSTGGEQLTQESVNEVLELTRLEREARILGVAEDVEPERR